MNCQVINNIEKKCKYEVIRYSKVNNNFVLKQYFTLDGNLKKSLQQQVTDKKLINRVARDTQDFMLNMVENYGYKICI